MRVALEQMEFDKEMENFVRDYGTGNQIPPPPQFIDYNKGETPKAPTSRSANFVRSSQRSSPLRIAQTIPPEEEEPEPVNTAGVGAGGGNRNSVPDPSPNRPISQPSNMNGVNGHRSTPSNASSNQHALVRKSTNMSYRHPAPDPMAETIDPTAETFIKVGSNAYRVDLNNDPQRRSADHAFSPVSAGSNTTADDPLARQLEELKNQVAAGTTRRNSVWRGQSGESASPARDSSLRDSLAAPGSSRVGASPSPTPRDYRNSAEMVVGAYPSASSRPSSPNPNNAPTAAFMMPRKSVSPGTDVVEGVLSDYHQSLPGERKSASYSRRNSFASPGHAPSPSGEQNLARPPSQIGHAGVGAHGGSRSNSPQPISRSTSPAPQPGQYMSPPSSASNANVARGNSMRRAASPNTMGIALASDGRVVHDEMATRYQQSQVQQQQQYRQPAPQGQPSQVQQYGGARQGSYSSPAFVPPPPPPPTQPSPQPQPSYTQPPSAPYGQPPSAQPNYAVPPPPIQQQPAYSAPPPSHYNPPQPQYTQPTSNYGSMGSMNGMNGASVQRGQSYYGAQTQRPMHSQQASGMSSVSSMSGMHSQQGSGGYQSPYRDAGPVQQMRRSPSPQPPMVGGSMGNNQVSDDGSRILFYGVYLLSFWNFLQADFCRLFSPSHLRLHRDY